MELDLRKLTHLVAVAEEGSFTRAASRLHLSQQALSTSVRALEREIGVQLLDRTGTTLKVLPAGHALIDDAHALNGLARSAVHRARRIGRYKSELLRIGHTPAVTSEEITTLLGRIEPAQTELATQVNQRYPDELSSALLAGELDIGLCRSMSPVRGLSRVVLTQHRLHVAVDADHRLAERGSVRLTDLRDETITVWGQPGRSGYTDLLVGYCRDAGFEPVIHRSPVQGVPPVTSVAGTGRIAFVTDEPGSTVAGGVRVLTLEPPHHAPLHALWPEQGTSHVRDEFLTAAADRLSRHDPSVTATD